MSWFDSVSQFVAAGIDYVAPRPNEDPAARLETAWKAFTAEHDILLHNADIETLDSTTCKALQRRNIGKYLKRIEGILLDEGSRARQEERRTATVPETPCYDFLLARGVVEDLCTRALANRPAGITTLIMVTVQRILFSAPHPEEMLPERSVHAPIHHMIDVTLRRQWELHPDLGFRGTPGKAGSVDFDRMTQAALIRLCHALWDLVLENPSRIVCLLQDRGRTRNPALLDALVYHAHRDGDLGKHARMALVGAMALRNDTIVARLFGGNPEHAHGRPPGMHHSHPLAQHLATSLAVAWSDLMRLPQAPEDEPTQLADHDVCLRRLMDRTRFLRTLCVVGRGQRVPSVGATPPQHRTTRGRGEPSSVTGAIVERVEFHVWRGALQPDLRSQEDERVARATSLLLGLLGELAQGPRDCSVMHSLLDFLARSVRGDPPLWEAVIARAGSLHDPLAIASMQLVAFAVPLHPAALTGEAVRGATASTKPSLDSVARALFGDEEPPAVSWSEYRASAADEALRRALETTEQARSPMRTTASPSIPRTLAAVILEQLEDWFEHSYDRLLALTGLVSGVLAEGDNTVAAQQLWHSPDDGKSLLRVLRELWEEVHRRAEGVDGFSEALRLTRLQLDAPEDGLWKPREGARPTASSSNQHVVSLMYNRRPLLQSVVLLEEFLKEIWFVAEVQEDVPLDEWLHQIPDEDEDIPRSTQLSSNNGGASDGSSVEQAAVAREPADAGE